MESRQSSNAQGDSEPTFSWLLEALPGINWHDEFKLHRQTWRAAKKALDHFSQDSTVSELEREARTQNAKNMIFTSRVQSSLAASMYLLEKRQS
jgi:hypothetical protein